MCVRVCVYLHISEKLWQIEVPLFTEAGQLQQETHCVIGFIQTCQGLYRAHGTQTLKHRHVYILYIVTTSLHALSLIGKLETV